jgi:hypothetical protein
MLCIFERIDDALLSDSQQQRNFQNLKNDVTHTKSNKKSHNIFVDIWCTPTPYVCLSDEWWDDPGTWHHKHLHTLPLFIQAHSSSSNLSDDNERWWHDDERRTIIWWKSKRFTHKRKNWEIVWKMPITPIFSLSQDKSSLTIKIRVPYVRVSVR